MLGDLGLFRLHLADRLQIAVHSAVEAGIFQIDQNLTLMLAFGALRLADAVEA